MDPVNLTRVHCGKKMVWQPAAQQWYCTVCHSSAQKPFQHPVAALRKPEEKPAS